MGGNQFMTSTPIRRGSEKIYLVSPSRVHSPIASHDQQRNNRGGDTVTSYEVME